MTRDEAREHWSASGLTFAAVADHAHLQDLRRRINKAMISSDCIDGTLRANQRFSISDKLADLRCRARYFENRQAVTIEASGFVGFAGWADNVNVHPILSAFCEWVDAVKTNHP